MATTIEKVAEIVYLRVNPKGGADAPNLKGEYIAAAKLMFAKRMYFLSKEQRREDGEFIVPSYLIARQPIKVLNGSSSDWSELKVMKGMGGDNWLMSLDSEKTDCPPEYAKFSINTYKTVTDGQMGNLIPYYPLGKQIIFPKGTEDKNVFVTYVSDGSAMSGDTEIPDDVAGDLILDLYNFYTDKSPEDKSNNNNPNN